jgi:hypothetical protein
MRVFAVLNQVASALSKTRFAPTIAADRRQHQRIGGPFDGWRVSTIDTPVRIYDLGRGGCCVNSLDEQDPGVRLTLRIDLPYEGWITVKAETLVRKVDFGYIVRFMGMSSKDGLKLDRAIEKALRRETFDE